MIICARREERIARLALVVSRKCPNGTKKLKCESFKKEVALINSLNKLYGPNLHLRIIPCQIVPSHPREDPERLLQI